MSNRRPILLGTSLTRSLGRERIRVGGFMDILAALRQEETKLQKQANAAKQQLDTVRAAIKILGRGVASTYRKHKGPLLYPASCGPLIPLVVVPIAHRCRESE